MDYDPIKLRLAKFLGAGFFKRRLFYAALDLLLLRAWYVHRELRRLSKIHPARGMTVLDAGMGFGQYSDWMLRKWGGITLIGLEIDRAHLYGVDSYFIRSKPRAHIALGDVQRMPLADGVIDLALSVDVMEHIEDDLRTFKEFYRVLKPGGVLVMHTPRAIDEPSGQDGRGLKSEPAWRVGEHVRDGYSDSDAVRKIEDAGLSVERLIHGYGAPGRMGWTLMQRIPLSLLSRRLGVLAMLFMAVALPLALVMMAVDYLIGDFGKGGSLLITARRGVKP